MIRTLARRGISILLWLVVVLALAVTIVPHFLDRIYYRGGASGHFDGARFFNPDGADDVLVPPSAGRPSNFMLRYLTRTDGRPAWPTQVPVTPVRPPARVTGDAMRVTWVGHATFLVQAQGLNILTDPVWSDTAGPFGIGPKRIAAPGIRFEDLPRIDLVLVSHDHYDHMDLPTLKRLWDRDHPAIVTSLGNDAVIGNAGVPAQALDWGRQLFLVNGRWTATPPGAVCANPPAYCGVPSVVVTRSHHWGSRWFTDRNRALWSSFVVQLRGGNLFFAGDTGPGDLGWADEAARHGPVRLALIPIGAFRFAPGQMVTGSHIGPLDAVRAWSRLGRPWAVPIHWGTFRLSWEARDTPPKMLHALLACAGQDPTRFAAREIGSAWDVPPLDVPPLPVDEARLAACAKTPEVARLR